MSISKIVFSWIMLLLFGSEQLKAQIQTEAETSFQETIKLTPWYVGIAGGVSFGVNTFNSFGADKTRTGYNVGVLVGYQINPVFSTEISVATGRVELTARKCCASNYWLGTDGIRYFAALTEPLCYSYSDIYSSVALQQLGLHLNINLVSLINRHSNSRWNVFVSPAIYVIGSKATIKTSSDHKNVLANNHRVGFGAGADVALGYAITESLGVRLGTGINVMTNNNFDGMPKGVHQGKLLWNSNLAFTWRFGKGISKNKSSKLPTVVIAQPQPQPKVEPIVDSYGIDRSQLPAMDGL